MGGDPSDNRWPRVESHPRPSRCTSFIPAPSMQKLPGERQVSVNRRHTSIDVEESSVTREDHRGVARVQEIEWSHPRMAGLTDAARLIYACLVDGCSSTARDTIDSVELVWRNRYKARARSGSGELAEVTDALDEICRAVEELREASLVVMLDEASVRRAWVMRPWESLPC